MLQTYSSIKKEKRGGFYELMLKLGSSNSMDLGKSWNTSSSSSSVSSHSFYVSAVLFMSFRCSVSVPKMALLNFSNITPSFDDDLILKFSSLSFS